MFAPHVHFLSHQINYHVVHSIEIGALVQHLFFIFFGVLYPYLWVCFGPTEAALHLLSVCVFPFRVSRDVY